MNRTGVAWAFAVLAVGSLMACSSSSGGSSGGGSSASGPSCPSGAMPPAMGTTTNSACNACLQSKCSSAQQCINTDCSQFSDCYCACQPTDTTCHEKCSEDLTSGSCGTCITNIFNCETQTCSSECLGGSVVDGG